MPTGKTRLELNTAVSSLLVFITGVYVCQQHVDGTRRHSLHTLLMLSLQYHTKDSTRVS